MPEDCPAIALAFPYGDPLAALAPHAEGDFALLFDSADRERGRYSYLCLHPRRVLTANAFDTTDAFSRLAEELGPHRPALPGLPPFQGGVAGYFAYELAHHVERLPRHQPDDIGLPAMAVGVFDAVAAWDHHGERAWVLGEPAAARRLFDSLTASHALPPLDWSATAAFAPDMEADDYRRHIAAVIEDIHAGDIFQANLSQRFTALRPPGLTPLMLYRRLRALTPAPFAAFLGLGENAILSASPEQFLKLDATGAVETRPIKGTRPRGPTPGEDTRLAQILRDSEKDRAENLMIVDLLRNDIARVCEPGSVTVPELWTLESHPTVHHLVSTVRGRLSPGKSPVDLLKAAFPGGSISGAPKIRAMEIITAHEPVRRGPYCGTIGWIGTNGAMDSSIAIRTMVMTRDKVYAQAGGGIVAYSDPGAEYEETLVKAEAMLASLEGRR